MGITTMDIWSVQQKGSLTFGIGLPVAVVNMVPKQTFFAVEKMAQFLQKKPF